MQKSGPLRILVICQHYWPEPFPLPKICETLAEYGHTVHVITDVPNYPQGSIYESYRGGKNRHEFHEGVEITRVLTIPRKTGMFFRVLNYCAYVLFSCLKVLSLKQTYDVVFISQSSPVIMACAGILYGKLRRKKRLLYCLDLWPASLKAAGIPEDSLLYRLCHILSGFLYRQADRILVTSAGFAGYMEQEFGLDDRQVAYLPQFSVCEHYENETVFDHRFMNVVWIGNLGCAQCPEVLAEAVRILERSGITDHGKQILFHIIGGGSCFETFRETLETFHIRHVILYGPMRSEYARGYLYDADCAVLSLTSDPDIGRTLPARIQMYLSAGKPVIASSGGEVMRLIDQKQCGICVPSENAEALADAFIRFLTSDRQRYAENAKETYASQFSEKQVMKTLEQHLYDLSGGAGK